MIIGALAAGLVIGLAIRYASRSDDKEVEIKTAARPDQLGRSVVAVSLAVHSRMKEKFEDSTEAVKESVKGIDVDRYAKPIRKRWKSWTS